MPVLGVRRASDPGLRLGIERCKIRHPADVDARRKQLRSEYQRGEREVTTIRPTGAGQGFWRAQLALKQKARAGGHVLDRGPATLAVVRLHERSTEAR